MDNEEKLATLSIQRWIQRNNNQKTIYCTKNTDCTKVLTKGKQFLLDKRITVKPD